MNKLKLSQSLVRRLEEAEAGELVDLVLELQPVAPPSATGVSRAEAIAQMREAFDREAAPVAAAIEGAGGHVTDSVWINQTLRASIPAGGVGPLTDLGAVLLLDLSRAVERD